MNSKSGLLIFALLVVASGCGGGGGEETGQSSSQAIAVEGPVVEPTEIYEDGSVRAELNVQNVGNIASNVRVAREDSEQNNRGREVLTNYCPDIFDITEEGFRASSTTTSENQETYELQPEHSLQLNWELEQQGDVPLNGYDCEMRFEVPFTYQVDAYRQIQIKQSEDIETAEELNSQSSNGPLLVYIEVIGSSAPEGSPVFLGPEGNRDGDNPEALIQLENQQPEDSAFQGLVEVENPDISVSGGLTGADCDIEEDEQLIIYNGESDIIRCPLSYGSMDTPSKIGEVEVSVDYRYIKTVGSQNVKVKSTGN